MMHRTGLGWSIGIVSVVCFSLMLTNARTQPPEGKLDPKDPLLQSIKERMGQLPRLDTNVRGDEGMTDGGQTKSNRPAKDSKGSRTLRAAEWMLKSARMLEAQAREIPQSDPGQQTKSTELLQIATELRKQVVVLLQQH